MMREARTFRGAITGELLEMPSKVEERYVYVCGTFVTAVFIFAAVNFLGPLSEWTITGGLLFIVVGLPFFCMSGFSGGAALAAATWPITPWAFRQRRERRLRAIDRRVYAADPIFAESLGITDSEP